MKQWKTPMDINNEFKPVVEVRCKKEVEGCCKERSVYIACSHEDYLKNLDIVDDSGNLHTIATSHTQDWASDEWFNEYFEVIQVL